MSQPFPEADEQVQEHQENDRTSPERGGDAVVFRGAQGLGSEYRKLSFIKSNFVETHSSLSRFFLSDGILGAFKVV